MSDPIPFDWPVEDIDKHEEARRKFVNSALQAKRRMAITRDPTVVYTGERYDEKELPRAKEKIKGRGMSADDIFGFCPPEEFEGFDEWLREYRARERARKPKI